MGFKNVDFFSKERQFFAMKVFFVKVNKDAFKIFYFSTCNERFAFGANNFRILATHTQKKKGGDVND
jgi:hypothetical protein